jgi:hypothetical protein
MTKTTSGMNNINYKVNHCTSNYSEGELKIVLQDSVGRSHPRFLWVHQELVPAVS